MIHQPKAVEQEIAAQQTGNPTPQPWDQVGGQFGSVPGKVFIDDFDLGVVRTLGAFLDDRSPTDEPSFILPVEGLKKDEQRQTYLEKDVVPVTFGHPEAFMSIWKLPGVFIRREGIEPDLTRYSQELEAFRIPAPNTQMVNGQVLNIDPLGPAELMQRQRAEAYNFIYVIDMIARYRTDANAMLQTILPRYKQHHAIIVRDSQGDLNEYTAFLESIDDLQTVLGVTMKEVGFSLNIRVVGELDLFDNVVRKTVTTIESEIIQKTPENTPVQPPNPYGLKFGRQAKVMGTICSMAPRVK